MSKRITSLTESLSEEQARNLLYDCSEMWAEISGALDYAMNSRGQINPDAKIASKLKTVVMPAMAKLPAEFRLPLTFMIAMLNEQSARLILGLYAQLWGDILVGLQDCYERDTTAIAGVFAGS